MADTDEQLQALRVSLDELDTRMVELINERARLAQQIGQVKAAAGERVYVPDRERQVLERVTGLNSGPVSAEGLLCIYRELMSASLALERSPRIAILGPAGSYSHLAARRKFGSSVEFEFVSHIGAVFDEIEHRHAEYGLVPVENSLIGGVGDTLDALVERDVQVCGESNLTIHHHLLGRGPLSAIEHVYSKPEVFAQCQRWLAETGLIGKTISVASSSAAAERAANEPNAAAIASELAGELFDLPRIAEHVEDEPGNVTRFLILGTKTPKPTGSDKTSVVFSVGHEPGRLVDALDVFRKAGVNMTRIESRPDRRKTWSYLFFVDLEGHIDTPQVAEALDTTAKRCLFWRTLGSYPAAKEMA